MRSLKFRAWDKRDKEMSSVFSLDDLYQAGLMGLRLEHKEDDYITMQYTGLKDKNGKEIYEGDIVKITKGWQKGGKADEIIGVIEYFTPYAGFGINGVGFNQLCLFPIEIIGNKYEDPKLIEEMAK